MTGPHTEEGGHYFNEGLAWPIEKEEDWTECNEGRNSVGSIAMWAVFALAIAALIAYGGFFLTQGG